MVVDSGKSALPTSFGGYLRSLGPGLVAVLTWLGAGDVVSAGVAGGNYGYALMWAMVAAILIRYFFVSLIAKYQLCNQHGEGVIDGLARVHGWYPPVLLFCVVALGHVQGAFLTVGAGETWVQLTGRGSTWQWAVVWSAAALALILRSAYRGVEKAFKVMVAVLSISLVGSALAAGPSPLGILRGTVGLQLPPDQGSFSALLVVLSMIGAVGGSIMNLSYPYFLQEKGWQGPRYRKLQNYDFLLAVILMLVLNLSVWTLGAEIIHGSDAPLEDLGSLSLVLRETLGQAGQRLFVIGVFGAVFTSLVGVALGLAILSTHSYLCWQKGSSSVSIEWKKQPIYRFTVFWVLVPPLVWTLPGMPGFVTLTLVGNAVQVFFMPLLVVGLWWMTASRRCIGRAYRNRWWENLCIGLVLALTLWGSFQSLRALFSDIG